MPEPRTEADVLADNGRPLGWLFNHAKPDVCPTCGQPRPNGGAQ